LDQPFMNFEINEKVKHFNHGQSFQELSSLELEPIVKIHKSDKQINISGHLVLSGEFLKKEDNWEEQIEDADGIHYGSFFVRDDEVETFQHQIPISFEVQLERVADPAQVYVMIENFDYVVLANEEMEVTAKIRLIGVHPEPRQERTVNFADRIMDETVFTDQQDTISNADLNQVGIDETANTAEFTTSRSDQRQQEISEEKVVGNQELKRIETNVEEEEPQGTAAIPDPEPSEAVLATDEQQTSSIDLPGKTDTPKMKIGIQSKNSTSSEKPSSMSNPLFSLYKKEQGKAQLSAEETDNLIEQRDDSVETASRKEKEISKSQEKPEKTVEAVKEIPNEEKPEAIEKAIESAKDQPKGEVASEEETIEVTNEGTKEQQNRKKTSDSKNMLFSLLQGNEEKKYKLKIYLVQKEDTLDLVAERYSLKREEILRHNSLASHQLEEGQLLYLPRER